MANRRGPRKIPDASVVDAPVAGNFSADDVVVQHAVDDLILAARLARVQAAADQAFLFSRERDEHEGLFELVLAHHARQFHDRCRAAAIVR